MIQEMTITSKIQILPDSISKDNLISTMKAYTDACNYVSRYIFETHNLKQLSLNKVLYQTLRDEFALKSQMAQSVLKTVIARYKTILENQKEWIQPVFKKLQYDLVWNRDYSITDNQFSVNTLLGRAKIAYYENGMSKYFDKSVYSFGTAKLVFKHNKFYLHIPVTFEIDACEMQNISNVVGIDRGINFVITTYDSKHKTGFVSGKQIKQTRSRYKETRKELQLRKTASARRRLKLIGQRENRWMQDVNHCISKALVESNPKNTLFVLEDLTGIRNALEKVKRKDRYVMVSWSFYDLETKIKYKSLRAGDEVINVNPRYTSQACPCCGHVEKANRDKHLHVFKCKSCGYTSNDDRVAAMNLHRMGINYLINNQVPSIISE